MMTTCDPMTFRVGEVRRELYGDDVEALARDLGVPARTWENYERGVTMPATVMLRFLDHTGVSSQWLLNGEGHRYRTRTRG